MSRLRTIQPTQASYCDPNQLRHACTRMISNTSLWVSVGIYSNTDHPQSFQTFLKQRSGQRYGQTITDILFRLAIHKRQLPTGHMIRSKMMDHVNVFDLLPLLAVLTQRQCSLMITPYHDRPTQWKV
jgi:hypothetical protein